MSMALRFATQLPVAFIWLAATAPADLALASDGQCLAGSGDCRVAAGDPAPWALGGDVVDLMQSRIWASPQASTGDGSGGTESVRAILVADVGPSCPGKPGTYVPGAACQCTPECQAYHNCCAGYPGEGEAKTCDQVQNVPAGRRRAYTCGARIDYVSTHDGKSEQEARAQIAEEYPSECGSCGDQPPPAPPPPPPPAPSPQTKTCEQVSDVPAGQAGYTCGARIDYLKNNEGKSEQDAKAQIAKEYPSECGACGDPAGGEGEGPSTAPKNKLTLLQFNPHWECLDPKYGGTCAPPAIAFLNLRLKSDSVDFANFVHTHSFDYSPPDGFTPLVQTCNLDRIALLYNHDRWAATAAPERGCHEEGRSWQVTPFQSVADGEVKLLVVNSHFQHIETSEGWDLKNKVSGLADKISEMRHTTGIQNVLLIADTNHKKSSRKLFEALNVLGEIASTEPLSHSTCCMDSPYAGPYDRVIANFGTIGAAGTAYPLASSFNDMPSWTCVKWQKGQVSHGCAAFHMPVLATITPTL